MISFFGSDCWNHPLLFLPLFRWRKRPSRRWERVNRYRQKNGSPGNMVRKEKEEMAGRGPEKILKEEKETKEKSVANRKILKLAGKILQRRSTLETLASEGLDGTTE